MSFDAPAPEAPPTVAESAAQPLDEVMLAMDVVDTLRRRERLVRQELGAEGREEELTARLRKIYRAQGIDVPDRIIEEGVAALRENRFVYEPPSEGMGVRLARLYVTRGQWGKWIAGSLGVLLLLWGAYYFLLVAPAARLPAEISEVHAQALDAARSDSARARADELLNAATVALQGGDTGAARQALESLEAMRAVLDQQYTLRIVNRPGEMTGVWRVPDINTGARNYYIVVEAVDPTGRALRVPITSEETGTTEVVSRWGLRVDERTFRQIANDKRDDGILQQDRFGTKRRGFLEPDYQLPTTGAAITHW